MYFIVIHDKLHMYMYCLSIQCNFGVSKAKHHLGITVPLLVFLSICHALLLLAPHLFLEHLVVKNRYLTDCLHVVL